MAHKPTDQASTPAGSASDDEHLAGDRSSPDVRSSELAEGYPRLIEEHHILGPCGEDQIEATDDQGRRWYHLRPVPRGRYDLVGFNYTWWLIWLLLAVLIFFPWGPGWGY